MSPESERMRVLELIREGKISVDDGVRLLEALQGPGRAPTGEERAPPEEPEEPERDIGEGGIAATIEATIKDAVGRAFSEDVREEIGKTVSQVASVLTEVVRHGDVSGAAARGAAKREERLASGWEPLTVEDGRVAVFRQGRLLVESMGDGITLVGQPDAEDEGTAAAEDEAPATTVTDTAARQRRGDEEAAASERTPEAAAWAASGEPAPEAAAWTAAGEQASGARASASAGLTAHVELISEGHPPEAGEWYAVHRGADVIIAAYPSTPGGKVPRLKVTLPAQLAEIAARTSGGSIETDQLDSPLDLRTSGGSITVAGQSTRPVTAKTSGGSIRVSGQPEVLDLRTSGGSITFTGDGPTKSFQAKTSGGSIRFTGRTESFQARTAGGSIHIEGAHLTSGSHQAKTAGGGVTVLLTPDSSVQINARTSAGGITVDHPGISGTLKKRGPVARRYRGVLGEGEAVLDLTTAAGSVRIAELHEAPAGE